MALARPGLPRPVVVERAGLCAGLWRLCLCRALGWARTAGGLRLGAAAPHRRPLLQPLHLAFAADHAAAGLDRARPAGLAVGRDLRPLLAVGGAAHHPILPADVPARRETRNAPQRPTAGTTACTTRLPRSRSSRVMVKTRRRRAS